jgi:hypothetical protein
VERRVRAVPEAASGRAIGHYQMGIARGRPTRCRGWTPGWAVALKPDFAAALSRGARSTI